jgi:hypothetical protein
MKPLFFNLSSKNLTYIETIIKFGLKHIPIPKDTSNKEIDDALERLKHRIGWTYLMNVQNKTNNDELATSKFKTTPKPFHFSGIYKTPLNYLQETIDEIERWKQTNKTHIVSNTTHQLITNLKNDPEIVFTPSDKNLGLTCLNTIDYHKLVMNHLQKNEYSLLGDITPNHFFDRHYQRTKQAFIKLMTETILPHTSTEGNKQIHKYLTEQLTRGKTDKFDYPAFHVLPKLHKGRDPLSSRPIVGAVDWFTTPISKLLSYYLQDTLRNINERCIITKTQDIVQHLQSIPRRTITNNSILVTMDIESLYTNIDLDTLSTILEHYNPFLKTLCDFINQHNCFIYLDQVYKQTNGIAMGTNAAPEMANIYLYVLLDIQMKQLPYITEYSRYLDDAFFIWNGSETSLLNFQHRMQSLIPKLRFSFHHSYKRVPFLDLYITIHDEDIHYYTHQKKLNKYAYITPKSSHPLHTFKGWITAELNRYKNNSSHRIYYERTKELFYDRLTARGYPRLYLNKIFKSHYYIVPTKIKSKDKPILPLIIRYSSRNDINTLPKLLYKNTNLKNLLPTHRIMVTWKKSKSILDMLCHSKLSDKHQTIIKSYEKITEHVSSRDTSRSTV